MLEKIKQWFKHRKDLREVINQCCKIRSEKITKGRAYFFPKKEDQSLYDELVVRGRFIKEPLENGYMFREDYEATWGKTDKKDNVYAEADKQ